MDYGKRRRDLRADLRGDRDDGQRDENDRIGADVENLTGGRGNDHLGGNGLDNELLGNRGRDRIKGRAGADRLGAGLSADSPTHSLTRDRLSGGSGDDTITGSWGRNRITGGPGQDMILASASADLIFARDGTRDQIECGAGADIALLDAVDVFDDCEDV